MPDPMPQPSMPQGDMDGQPPRDKRFLWTVIILGVAVVILGVLIVYQTF